MDPDDLRCVRAVVSGRVQGVYYRATTQQEARALDLRGWVRNLPDGRVELVAQGGSERVQRLLDWLWQGPSGARVDGVTALEEEPAARAASFEIRR